MSTLQTRSVATDSTTFACLEPMKALATVSDAFCAEQWPANRSGSVFLAQALQRDTACSRTISPGNNTSSRPSSCSSLLPRCMSVRRPEPAVGCGWRSVPFVLKSVG